MFAVMARLRLASSVIMLMILFAQEFASLTALAVGSVLPILEFAVITLFRSRTR
jgi:hypothetical protein